MRVVLSIVTLDAAVKGVLSRGQTLIIADILIDKNISVRTPAACTTFEAVCVERKAKFRSLAMGLFVTLATTATKSIMPAIRALDNRSMPHKKQRWVTVCATTEAATLRSVSAGSLFAV